MSFCVSFLRLKNEKAKRKKLNHNNNLKNVLQLNAIKAFKIRGENLCFKKINMLEWF